MFRKMTIELPEKSAPHAAPRETEVLEQFVYDDAIVRKFLVMTYVWGVVAMVVGLWVAITLILPPFRDSLQFHGAVWAASTHMLVAWIGRLAQGLSSGVNTVIGIPYFNFGRIRPLHTNAAIFASNCVACHNRDGSGLPNLGVNLTDDYYINIVKIADIADVVTNGRKNGAMPTWRGRLSPNEIVQVSAYVASLRGQNKPGRPHDGNLIPAWSEQ
jgi:cytochrome c553